MMIFSKFNNIMSQWRTLGDGVKGGASPPPNNFLVLKSESTRSGTITNYLV